ncbi:MAG: MFS transporter [Verrucomicrobia bacterium]|nr:MFS transporter [Verrucomicrobiota bacterium]
MNEAPRPERSRLDQQRLLWIILPLFIGSILAYLDRVNIAYAALTMNPQLGFGAAVYGLGAGVFFAGYVLCEIPGALIAERWSPRLWLARILITWGLVSAAMAFIRTPWQFYLARFLLGAAEASFYPVAYASVIPRWYAPAERPRVIALMLTSLPLSAIIGGPLAGWLLSVEAAGLKGWQILFLVEAIPAVAFGFILPAWLPDRPSEARWLSAAERATLEQQRAQEIENLHRVRRYSVLQALTDREVLKLCLIYFLWITGFWGFNYWMPTELRELSGWSTLQIGWISVLPMGLALAGMLWVGRSATRTGERRWHGAIPLFLGAVGLAIGALSRDPLFGLIGLCAAGVGVYGAFGVWWSYPTSFLAGPAAAGAVGLINSCGNLGGGVGPPLTGFVKEATGSFQWAYVALSACLALAGLLMLSLRRR